VSKNDDAIYIEEVGGVNCLVCQRLAKPKTEEKNLKFFESILFLNQYFLILFNKISVVSHLFK